MVYLKGALVKFLVWWLGIVVHGVGIVLCGDAHALTRSLLIVSVWCWAIAGVLMGLVAGARLAVPAVKSGLLSKRGEVKHGKEEGQEGAR